MCESDHLVRNMRLQEEIDRLARLCKAKDAEIAALTKHKEHMSKLATPSMFTEAMNKQLQQQLSEAQAQKAMQADILETLANLLETDGRDKTAKVTREAIAATSDTVAAWRAKETEPLRREVSALRNTVQRLTSCVSLQYRGVLTDEANNILDDTQATALAYEREVEAKELFSAAEDLSISGLDADCKVEIWLRKRAANKGEVK